MGSVEGPRCRRSWFQQLGHPRTRSTDDAGGLTDSPDPPSPPQTRATCSRDPLPPHGRRRAHSHPRSRVTPAAIYQAQLAAVGIVSTSSRGTSSPCARATPLARQAGGQAAGRPRAAGVRPPACPPALRMASERPPR